MVFSHGEAGRAKTPEWMVWNGMLARCRLPTHCAYERYGGRGIEVCQRWQEKRGNGFLNFLEDMGRRPSSKHSLDRTDNDGNYTPENCRWATREQQARNRRSNRILSIRGEKRAAVEWAEKVGLEYTVLKDRLRGGWTPERAVFTPKRGDASLNVGSVFGFWTIVGDGNRSRHGVRRYLCRCRCGKEREVTSYDLRCGKSTQCRSCSLAGNQNSRKQQTEV